MKPKTTPTTRDQFDDAAAIARSNVREKKRIERYIRPLTYRWARRFHRLLHLPFLLNRVFVRGFENLPPFEEPAPILAFAHKKIHDVCAVSIFMIARPLERFHNLTLVAQGGLFNGIYPWRDLTPGFIQKSFLRRPAAALARLIGRGLRFLMLAVNANPVFREGSDLPVTPEAYDAPAFAGPLVMGMDYPNFVKFANRETRTSVITAQREMVDLNRSFLIFPEGIYMHDGAVSETQDLAGVAAFRKQRSVLFISLTYDEFCPDRFRRIDAWLNVAPLREPPARREDISEYLRQGRANLQESSIILPSHLIALALREFRERDGFQESEVRNRFEELAEKTAAGEFLFDPGLRNGEYRKERWRRFMRSRKNWFRKQGGKLFPHRENMARFAASERTVDDIEWNCNNIRHAWDYLLSD